MPSTPSSRSRTIAVVTLVAAIVVGVAAYVSATRGDDGAAPAVLEPGDLPGIDAEVALPGVAEPGQRAPEVVGTTLDGEAFAMDDLAGRPFVLNFWASWCYPCRAEFPLLREVDEDGDVAVVGVLYRDIPSDAAAFVEDFDARWPQVLDEDRAIAERYGVRSIPRTFFVDAEGTITASVYGFTEESFRRHLDRLRGG